ncbi:MAG: cation diffusion facilitator family transporter [Fidelibacterota bacterium]
MSGKKLPIIIGILGITFFAELIGGLAFNSLSLVSDSFHVFFDLFALILAYAALSIARKKLPTDKMTYGYHRLEVFSAMINGFTLVIISIFILIEVVDRYSNPVDIKAGSAAIIAVLGLGINVIAALMLRADSGDIEDLNIRGAYYHILGDAMASIAVIIGMVVIVFTDYYFIDPVVAGLISILILYSAFNVLREGLGILIHKAPRNIEQIRKRVKQIDGVIDMDDFRLWQVCSHLIVGTAHVITSVEKLEDTEKTGKEIKELLFKEYNVRHLTLEFETSGISGNHSHKFEHDH